jgi:hypothetical protein
VVTHTYPAAGVYTAVVTATNSVSEITATTPVTILAPYELALVAGWNLVSWPLAPHSTSLTDILDPLGGTCDEAWAYDAGDGGDPWKPWPGDLTQVDETMGLWLHATEPVTLTLTGWPPISSTIPLQSGWNLVGYPSATARPVDEALASIAGSYARLATFDSTDPANPWLEYTIGVPTYVNDLTVMEPGRGYWISATVPCTLTIVP